MGTKKQLLHQTLASWHGDMQRLAFVRSQTNLRGAKIRQRLLENGFHGWVSALAARRDLEARCMHLLKRHKTSLKACGLAAWQDIVHFELGIRTFARSEHVRQSQYSLRTKERRSGIRPLDAGDEAEKDAEVSISISSAERYTNTTCGGLVLVGMQIQATEILKAIQCRCASQDTAQGQDHDGGMAGRHSGHCAWQKDLSA
eukprot:3396496-Rhodomonas_salina.2